MGKLFILETYLQKYRDNVRFAKYIKKLLIIKKKKNKRISKKINNQTNISVLQIFKKFTYSSTLVK